MSFNAFGKPAETVDFGGEVDYASYEWFKDPPPRSEVSLPFFTLANKCFLTLVRLAPRRPAPTPSKRGLYTPPERHREEYDV